MNDFYNNYEQVIIETPAERENKKRLVRRIFSRVFLALFIYLAISQLASTLVYLIASIILSEAQYVAFVESSLWSVVVSSCIQYLIGFPIFILSLVGCRRSEKTEKSKLSIKDFVLLFCAGEVLMYVGNLVGVFLNNVIGSITGKIPENDVANIISDIPMWLIILIIVVIGPIVEELICRKFMIDRLSVFGDHIAIIFSAVAFGMLHANLYQFFYAALLGLVLGYVYTKTRNVKYTIIMHMAFNFFGSIIALYVERAMTDFYEILELANAGETFNFFALIFDMLIMFGYMGLQYGMLAGGVFAFIYFHKNRLIKINTDKEVYLPDADVIHSGIVNVGAILFLLGTLTLTILNLILT